MSDILQQDKAELALLEAEAEEYVKNNIQSTLKELYFELTEEEKKQGEEELKEELRKNPPKVYPHPMIANLNRKWTTTAVLNEVLYMYFYIQTEIGQKILFVKNMTSKRGYTSDTITGALKVYAEEQNKQRSKRMLLEMELSRRLYKTIQEILEDRILNKSSYGEIRSNIAQLILVNHHGYTTANEKVENTSKDNQKKSAFDDFDPDNLTVEELKQMKTLMAKSKALPDASNP